MTRETQPDPLPHTTRIERLLKAGKRSEAAKLHTQYVAEQLERSKHEPINLSDLIAGKEAFIIDEVDQIEREQNRKDNL